MASNNSKYSEEMRERTAKHIIENGKSAKQSLVLGRSPYQWKHEPILYGWLKEGKHNWYADRKQSTIWNFDRPSKNTLHPTMKPVGLIAYPIQNSSMSNCLVLDSFGGSGSTLIACEQTNRICNIV